MPVDYYNELSVGGVKDRRQIIDLNAYWHDMRVDYDGNGDIIYRGVMHLHNEATSETNWEIWKYTYGSYGLERTEGPLPGAWDDRATLNWG